MFVLCLSVIFKGILIINDLRRGCRKIANICGYYLNEFLFCVCKIWRVLFLLIEDSSLFLNFFLGVLFLDGSMLI